MASNRHLGRIVVLQSLYEYDFRTESGDSKADLSVITDRNVDRYKETIEDKEFIHNLVEGVSKRQDELDDIIRPIAPEWPVEQIARIDRNILRMALWELYHAKDVPPKVVINEAVELGKAFGGDNSSKFINGVLGTAYRELEEKDSKSKKTSKKSTKKTTKTTKKSTAKNSTTKKKTTKK